MLCCKNPHTTTSAYSRSDVYHRSVTGKHHSQEGTPNQDFHFVARPPTGELIAGVFDGHGPEGHILSEKTACVMRNAILKRLDAGVSIRTMLTAAFAETAGTISESKAANESGTTATVVVIRGHDCFIAYAGDSSAVLFSKDWRGTFAPKFTTQTHRPGVSRTEDARIRAYGGVLYRGYVVDKVTRRKGIAVTRTLGDNDMVNSGCIPDPQIECLSLTKKDSVIVIASDGLWDQPDVSTKKITSTVEKFVTNKAANANIDTQDDSNNKETCAKSICEALITLARVPFDDCSVLVICLQESSPEHN